MVRTFENDLAGYKAWADGHSDGYVLNLRDGNKPPMLHRTTCVHVFLATPEYGDFTKTKKVCSRDRTAVEEWAAKSGCVPVLCSNCDV